MSTGEHPILTLGGRHWPVPPLAIGQLRHVVPAVLRLGTVEPTAISEAAFEDIITVILWGLRRAHPEISRDDVLGFEATAPQLLAAAAVVAGQTGMLQPLEGGRPGE